ncbi:flagellar hook-basal body complex protein FliE [Yoonia litorea]|uniref:Flagellar hook-basal body complex protein FliE n=1 Tax=Yoonia litorea TaxID=1123755 RepID=A0A1I6MU18_9RHOB|nr:flagellar hook-basal body complex protein FliE [Yoonia litorea]SFS19210.1 flagellar hook-basal body complex protein FliE [Yoonia litorea]
MDVNSIVAQSYAATKNLAAPSGNGTANALTGAAESFAATLQRSETVAMQSMTSGADPHALVDALVQTELAVQTAVTVRDRVVEAYQEILRMPV